jgi:hypothetical protein
MNVIQKIKEVLKKYQFEKLQLSDGTEIETDTERLEVGSMVLVTTADGQMPAPAGEHVLSDGRSIVTDDAGKVLEVKESNAPVAEEMNEAAEAVGEVRSEIVDEAKEIINEQTPSDVTPEMAEALAEQIVSIVEDKVAEANMEMKKKMEEMASVLDELVKSQKEFTSDFQAFKKEPSGKSISQMAFTEDAPTDVMSARIQAIKALKESQK